ncbi:fructose-bisphosphate aldolase [Sanguibacter gelidistatuariae]|uniref:Fructose-bisphosphate aldolase n=1 Tax=Sanguibacter gelidistatuariae TaxID=1814289 RepID=A0A1G6H937_9MICO|nr:class II fructose-bisphosphate aldolase [Sanguibacter gelidistatuariae]SDB90673.1 fructose-bisphosphate aldolase [Sanguibacter gelidistatuariae]
MTLVDLASVAGECAREQTGLGAFNVVHIEHAEAFVAAAERAGRPVVLQVSENAVAFHGSLAPLGAGVLAAARSARVPVVVHLDHAKDTALIAEAIALGFTSVMYDGSHLPYEQNLAATAAVVAHAHARGVSVEAELGEVGGKDGVHHPGARTDPDEAGQFAAATGIDLLAVAVGSSHAMTTRGARLDTDLITALAAAVPVPLVLHGSSGVSDEGMRSAIAAGIIKVNVSTHLNTIFTASVRDYLEANPAVVDTRRWFAAGIEPVGVEVERLLGKIYVGPREVLGAGR